MEKVILEREEAEGKLRIIKDYDRHLFLARPEGVINPDLLAEDLKRAKEFSEECQDHWSYCTNTEAVRLVNPLNLFFLKEIKKLRNLRQIVIYAPGFVNRILIKIVSPIVRPDRILKRRDEFENFIQTVS